MTDWVWPISEAHRAFEALAAASGLAPDDAGIPEWASSGHPSTWLPSAGAALGLELEPTSARYREIHDFLRASGPSLIVIDEPPGVIAVLRSRGRVLEVLAPPDGGVVAAPVAEAAARCTAAIERELGPQIERIVAGAAVRPSRLPRVRRALLREALDARDVVTGWLLRSDPGEAASRALGTIGARRLVGLQVGAHLGQLALTLAGWSLLGRSIFAGRVDRGWILACSLLFASAVPFQIAEQWIAGMTTLRVGSWMRRRLLVGALRLAPEEVRLDGTGAHLGRVIESESLQALVLTGATAALLGVLEIIAAMFVLAAGAGGVRHSLLLVGWCIAFAFFIQRYVGRRSEWTESRLRMTTRGIERMLGYETRLLSERASEWSHDEDLELSDYVTRSRAMDASLRRLTAVVSRGWLLVGLAGLIPALLFASATAAGLAVGIGGVLLAYAAFSNLTIYAASLVDAGIGWRKIRPLFRAAERRLPMVSGLLAGRSRGPDGTERITPVLELREVVFSYPGRARAVLSGVSLALGEGERVLVDGPSGSGKSTLAALIAGLRSPNSGLVLMNGLDLATIGQECWHGHVAAAPQFHENHVLTGTLAFNLLLGRAWPPGNDDLELATEVCRELGLGPLLERMPSELLTMVGETGWQLSHGERSRIFIARALLQGATVVVLDESFAALDPETLSRCVETALRRAATLMVVAHVGDEGDSR